MIKNNKGITMITLVITIIVLIIISSIAINNGYQSSIQAEFYNAISEMKAMQSKVNSIYEDYINGTDDVKNEIENYGQSLDESGKSGDAQIAYNDVKEHNITGENIGDIDDYRYYSKDYIKNDLDTDGIDYDFIVNIKTRTVILIDGVIRDKKERN